VRTECEGVYGAGKREREKKRKKERERSWNRCKEKSLDFNLFDAWKQERCVVCIVMARVRDRKRDIDIRTHTH